MEAQRIKTRIAWLSVVSNTALVVLKLLVGVVIGSVSVISEAIHSGVDLVAAVIALFAVHTAHKPADDDHPYGHGKVENISGTVEALLIFCAALGIIYKAMTRLIGHAPLEHDVGIGIVVMLVSAVVNLYVSSRLLRVGIATDSVALQADAWHLRTDVYTSIGVTLGLAVIWVGKRLLPQADLNWVDPVAAMAVAVLILKAAWDLVLQSGRDLLDASLPRDEEAWIRDYLERLRPTICGYHRLRTRKAGANRFVEVHLKVEKDMSVVDSHNISEVMSCDIEDRFPGTLVTVHIEPCDGLCKPHCQSGCLLTDEERAEVRKNTGC